MASVLEWKEKERRVREFMASEGYGAVLLKRQANFCWMTCGGLNLVGITTELGANGLLITADRKFVVTNNIEAPRMIQEEGLEAQGFSMEIYPWHEERETSIVKALAGGKRFASDVPFPGADAVPEKIARLRYSLTPEEVERYRWLGERVSLNLEQTLMETRRGEKESEVVGKLCLKLWQDRIDPVTLMAAADERVYRFRHPIPTEKRFDSYLMVSVNARKWGLIVSLTRFLHFGRLPADLRERYLANVFIDCTFMAETRPGVPARDVLGKGLEAYRKTGYAEEWRLHHQGGSIGYTGRDYRTHFDTTEVVAVNQAFTWNPSITGTKSEDTILATPTGMEMITRPMIYPTLSATAAGVTFERAAILERS
jgi:Xaa-Pro aminopeptidase